MILYIVYLNILEILGIDPEPGPQVSQISRRRIQLKKRLYHFNDIASMQCQASSEVDKSLFSGLTNFAVLFIEISDHELAKS